MGGDTSLVVKTDGTFWTWGYGAFGVLGLGNQTYYSSPVQVGALTTWAKPTGGRNHTLASKTDGTIWAVGGQNTSGQLGLSDNTGRSSPVQIGSLTTWSESSISAGQYHSLALTTGGALYAWGSNGQGRLGDGTTTNRNSPVQIGALTTWARCPAAMGFSGFTVVLSDQL